MYNKEALRKLLEDCWNECNNYIRPDDRDKAKEPYITSRLAALDDGDDPNLSPEQIGKLNAAVDDGQEGKGVLDFNELMIFDIIDIVTEDCGLGFYSTKKRKELMNKFLKHPALPVADGEGEKVEDDEMMERALEKSKLPSPHNLPSAVTGGVKDEIIKAQDEYIKFLDKESAPFISFAFVHNMLVSKMVVNEGERHREKISDLKRIDEGQPAQGGKP